MVCAAAQASFQVTIRTDVPSPQPVAALVTFTAEANPMPSRVWYRFRVRPAGGDWRMVRDFGLLSDLIWTASEWEGEYEIEATIRDRDSGEEGATITRFEFQSRVDFTARVSETSHPLVMLYSVPACGEGRSMEVEFTSLAGVVQRTPAKSCRPGRSMNFYLAGLRPGEAYTASHLIRTPGEETQRSTPLRFQTGNALPPAMARTTVSLAPLSMPAERFTLHSPIFPQLPRATDLDGTVVWYYPGAISIMTRMGEGGTFWGFAAPQAPTDRQLIREWDLAGMTLRETTSARLNEQLRAQGKREIGGFHHEVFSLPDGRVVVLAGVEQMIEEIYGPEPANVMGDMILVLDRDLQVLWTWDAFDHMDIGRKAILGQKCSLGGCSPTFNGPDAEDWVHGNAVTLTPDGNFLYSPRHQDWVIKIRFENGNGDGAVIWRLGREGDFTLDGVSDDAWFSHQHDPIAVSPSEIALFDNGNTRWVQDQGIHSRGQVWQIDEGTRTAKPVLNADLQDYAFALGSAQRLAEGRFHFGFGWELPSNHSLAMDVDADGVPVFVLRSTSPTYRSYRVLDLYSAPR